MTPPVRIVFVLAVASLAACGSKDRSSCASGQERCNGFCVDPASYATDPLNCGGCGIACGVGSSCAGGTCQCGALTLCPASNPRCTDLATDRLNCGMCGNACQRPNESCAGGTCACVAPFTDCGTSCANTQTDAANCNGCGNVCPLANDVCVAGSCQCPAGTTECPVSSPTACANLTTDEANCGACGTVCATGATCTSSVCHCPAGEVVCNGACVNPQTDPSNCGACGHVCAVGASCAANGCTCSAAEPTVCGVTGGSAGTCCAGNGCCTPMGGGASICETEHTNGTGVPGLGQKFYDCLPLHTYDATQAQKAAQAWDPGGRPVSAPELGCPSQSCLGWRTAHACGTWCYGGAADPLRGRATVIQSIACVCPTAGAPNWN